MHSTNSLLVALAGFLAASSAGAFEVEGFRTGMSKDEVVSTAEKRATLRNIDENTVVATDPSGSYLSFNFCKGSLAAIQQGFPATLKHVSLLTAEFNKRYGKPFSIDSGSRADPSGEIHEMGIWWKAGSEYISLYYMGTPQGDSLSASHQSKNSCFKVPR